ncbi:Xaa-Pro peptidase family protein [Novosphingobium sp. 1949]|uniref:Xaa-Pro peptidase family protein n=1 Tax=Novosphingobium organovorum TaxID=2930092 RepID=A0ABT0BHF0_9SPHN|nr:Xaa-Pro peptidase family protein [Novosphingobium organovorum]MCJ2184497.1 Xaa-Pro peptidase family protein [Novosphingobium organovorum]
MIAGSDPQTELDRLTRWQDWAPAITPGEYQARLAKARALIGAAGADALVVNAGPSLTYFTGVRWSPTERLVALVLPLAGEPVIVCPAFERGSLEAELRIAADLALWEEDEDPVAAACARLGPNARLALDPWLAAGHARRFMDAVATTLDGAPVIDGCRMVKSAAELALMQQAKAMTLEVHKAAARILAPGIRASEVIRFIDQAHRALGASGSYFCAVQFGHATAYPHGLPYDQELEDDQLVLIDTGCRVEGYHSDITRTYAFGRVEPLIAETWALEKEAQAAAFAAVKPGVPCEEIDAAARRVLEAGGLGPDYALPGLPHRTGHGIGLAIHEPAYLVRGDKTPLEPGMCFSNEPMIVYPERFGVRLEDHFYVTQDGARWFTEPQVALDRPFA